MNVNDFYQYLANPQLLNKASLDEIEEVIERYPYFQLARMLYLKNLYMLNDDRYQQTLEKFSIYISDRKRLFEFIHDKKNTDKAKQTETIYKLPNTQNEELENTTSNTSKTLLNSQVTVEHPSTKEIKLNSTINVETEINKENQSFQENKNVESSENKQTETKISIADLILQKIESQKKATHIEENPITAESKKENYTESFTIESTFTFQEWLDRISVIEITQNQPKNNTSNNLIDNFLQNINQIERIKPQQKPDIENEDLTENLLPPEEIDLVSEQLAQLYYKQGHLDRALKMYEKLFLKYPEKSIYFANLIQEIKQKLNKK